MCGGSNVPPRMARMVARIRTLRHHGTQPQCHMRIQVAAQCCGRVDVLITDPHREVEGHTPFVESNRADDVASADLLTGRHEAFGEVRVRGPHTAVIDRHRGVPDHNTAERNDPAARCTNPGSERSSDVDAPVPAVATGRAEGANNLTRDRRGESDAHRRGKRGCKKRGHQERNHGAPPPSPHQQPTPWTGRREDSRRRPDLRVCLEKNAYGRAKHGSGVGLLEHHSV